MSSLAFHVALFSRRVSSAVGSLRQLLVVIGLGEMILGRWLTIAVALVAHVGSTLIARTLLLSLHGPVFGLTPALARALDTGPSAATTAVGACLLIAARMNRSAALLCVGLLVAALVAPGLDGVEHTAALVWGLLAGFLYVMITSRSHDVPRRPRGGPEALASFARFDLLAPHSRECETDED